MMFALEIIRDTSENEEKTSNYSLITTIPSMKCYKITFRKTYCVTPNDLPVRQIAHYS